MALTKVTGHVIKSDTNITSHNINSSGIITAITFDGNVSGVAVTFTGDSTIGSLGITTNLSVGGNIDVDGHTELDNVNVAGVTTFNEDISFKGANFDFLYDRSLNTLKFDQGIAAFGTSGQMTLQNQIIRGVTNIKAGGLYIQNLSNQQMISCYTGGQIELYYNNSKKFNTTNTGASVTGNLAVSGNMNVEGVLTYQDVTNIDSIGIVTARSDIRGGRNLSVVGISTLTGDVKVGSGITFHSTNSRISLPDGTTGSPYTGNLELGNNRDFTIVHDSNHTYMTNRTGNFYIGISDSVFPIRLKSNNTAEIYHGSTKVLETTSTGVSFNDLNLTNVGTIACDSIKGDADDNTNITFAGNDVITFKAGTTSPALTINTTQVKVEDGHYIVAGTGNDFKISHSAAGSASDTIDSSSGYLYINSDALRLNSRTSAWNYLRGDKSDGVVKLYKSNSQRLATSDTGITVTGEVKASQEYPLTKPVLDFNFAAEKKLDPRIQFTRDSVATFVDKKGIVRYASNNQPRFDHHPTTGVSLGLLLEKQSINYQPYSVDMSQGSGNNGVTVENNAAIAPDGTMTASKITGGTDQNTSQRLGWGTQGVASNSYTMWSIWLKSEETSCIIQIYSNTYTFGADVITVELADGTMGGHSGEFGDTTFRYNLEKYPNKWWRLSWGGNGNAGGNSGGMYVAVVPALNSARAANTGSAHSKVWYAWGLQEEVGTQRKFATSYIPTNGASVTRAADRGTIDGDDFDDFFDRYQGAVVHESSNAIQSWTGGGSGWEFNNDNYQYNVITNISSGYSHNGYPGGYAVAHGESSDTGTNSMSQFGPNSATGNQPFNNGYYAGRTPNNSNVDYNRLYKTYTDGMSWDVTGSTNTLTSAVGGFSATGTNTNVISYRNISKLEFGSDATDMDGSYQKFSGRIKRWMYYDKALTATQLENLTAQDPVTYL